MIIDTPTLGTATYRKPLRKSMICVGAILFEKDAIYPKATCYQIIQPQQPPTNKSWHFTPSLDSHQ